LPGKKRQHSSRHEFGGIETGLGLESRHHHALAACEAVKSRLRHRCDIHHAAGKCLGARDPGPVGKLTLRWTGAQGRGPHAGPSQLIRQCFGKRQHKRLAGEIGRHQWPGHIRGNRSQIDHAAAPASQHARQKQPRELGERHNIYMQQSILLIGIRLGERALCPKAGTIDQHIDGHLPIAHRLEHFPGGTIPTQIGRHHLDADRTIISKFTRRIPQQRLAPGDQDQVVISLGQKPGHGLTDAGGRAGHQRRLPGRKSIGWRETSVAHVLSVKALPYRGFYDLAR
jgi:hypothetical protein